MTDSTGEDAQTGETPSRDRGAEEVGGAVSVGQTVATPTAGARPGPRPPGIAEGTVLAGRFRVLRFIARGGMGEVYEAEDQVLRERVAVKTIRPDVAGDARVMERFLREVNLARSVTHPNVARTFDIFPEGPVTFLTMELLSGETLARRLARTGRMRPSDALPLVEQMAAALASAHEAGIVHRDFKSANVMLSPDERRPGGVRAVVTDFGLARRDRPGRGEPSLTETEAVMGTPDYMAPEQIEGRAVSPATDVYALGIVLYEMVTGEPPYQGDSPISVALKKLKEPPPSPRGRVADLPAEWERTILRCLERDPRDRFASVDDVVRALRGEAIAAGTGVRARRRRLRLAAVAAGLLLAAGVGGLLYRYRGARRAAPQPATAGTVPAAAPLATRPARRSIAVLGFKNLAGRKEDAWVSTALSEMLTTELAAGETLRAISSEDVARMKSDLSLEETDTLGRDSLARVRKNVGADIVLVGSYLVSSSAPPSGERGAPALRLDLRLQDTAAGETIAVVSEKGSASEVDGIATRAGEQLREKLRLPAVSSADAAAVRASLPSNPEAARLYAEGLARLRVFDSVAARDLLQKAVALDPKHALARSALAAAWAGLGYDAKALEASEAAFVLSGDLSRETRLAVEGRYRSSTNEWDRAVEIYRSLFTFYPDNLEYGLQLANAQTRAGRANEALATIAALRRAFPKDDPRIGVAEAETAKALSDFPRMEKAAVEATALADASGARLVGATARMQRGIARRNLGDPRGGEAFSQQARDLFEAAGDRKGAASALNGIGNARYDQGDLPGALTAYEQVLAIGREIGNKRVEAGALDNVANVVGDQGDLAKARKLAEASLALFGELGDKAGQAEALNNIGAGLVIAGDLRGARESFERAIPLYQETGDDGGRAIALTNIAELQWSEGNPAGAAKSFEESLATFRSLGQKSRTVYPATGLATVRAETGDLAGARALLAQALPACREAHDRHQEAFVLSGLGSLDLAEDKPKDARQNFEQALKIRNEIGEKGAAAQSRYDLARVALAEGDAKAARDGARQAADELRAQRLPDDEALALSLATRAALESGSTADAAESVERTRRLAVSGQHETARREYVLASSLLRAARGDAPGARRSLEGAIASAREKGLLAYALEASLALGRIEMRSGAAASGRARLADVAKDAAARGFVRIARRASEARA
ncbi:MAG TPA: tetratricopeptide repeat protein [Thermoanaerobaculia bacterium]